MKKNKNIIIFLLFITISVIININKIPTIINNASVMTPTLLSILALSITSYSIIISPLKSINTKELKDNIDEFLKEYETDMYFIFGTCIVTIIVEILTNIDLISTLSFEDIFYKYIKINLTKNQLLYMINCIFVMFSIYCFYDIIKSTFTILKAYMKN